MVVSQELSTVSILCVLSMSVSVWLGTGELNRRAPLFNFFGDQLGIVGGGAGKHRAPQVGQPGIDPGIGEGGVDLLIELVDDFGRRVSGRADAKYPTRLIARDELSDSWDIGQRLEARRSCDRERAHLSRFNIYHR